MGGYQESRLEGGKIGATPGAETPLRVKRHDSRNEEEEVVRLECHDGETKGRGGQKKEKGWDTPGKKAMFSNEGRGIVCHVTGKEITSLKTMRG